MTDRIAAAGNRSERAPVREAGKRAPVYVVYPAALFDGWEVVRDGEDDPTFFASRAEATAYARSRAAMSGGGTVKLENWFGDTEGAWEVPARAAYDIGLVAS